MTLLAISEDPSADSLAFARREGLAFPLLADIEGTVARQYTGLTSDRAARPGVVIIARDGRVVFRKLGESKADRMSAAEVLAALDASLGTSGPTVGATDYPPLARLQLRLAAGGGVVRERHGTAAAQLELLAPLGRHVLVGPTVAFEPRDAPLDVNATLLLRAPIWNELGAIELGATGGWTAISSREADARWNAGARAGLWFALSPAFSVQLGATVTTHGGDATAALITFGVARLFQRHGER